MNPCCSFDIGWRGGRPVPLLSNQREGKTERPPAAAIEVVPTGGCRGRGVGMHAFVAHVSPGTAILAHPNQLNAAPTRDKSRADTAPAFVF